MKFTNADIGCDVIVKYASAAGTVEEPGKVVVIGHTPQGNPYVAVHFLGQTMQLHPDCVTKVVARKFTDADIGKRVKVSACEGPAKDGTVIGVYPKQTWPVVVDVDGVGHTGYMHREVMFEREVEVAAPAGTCDECQGTGTVELLTSFVPCSKGCAS